MSAARSRVVNGVQIPERLIAEEAQNHPADTAEAARHAAGHALSIRALLLNQAQLLDLEAEAEIGEDGREETPEEALIRAVLDSQVSIAQPTGDELLKVYETQPGAFRSPDLTEASHILIEPGADEDEAWAAARARAEALIVQLAEPGVRFADLARSNSACTSAEIGGSLGQLSPGDLTAPVEVGLLQLQPGEVSSEPVRSRFGWHILRLDRRIEGRVLPFEHVREQIALHLESRAWIAAAGRYVGGLASEARERGVAIILSEDGGFDDGVMSLGDLLQDREGVAARVHAWLTQADGDLASRVQAAAERADLTFADFVRDEITDFISQADDEGWTRLISAAQGADDPALGCVRAILKARLQPVAKSYTLIKRA